MDLDELTGVVRDLAARVERLEGAPVRPGAEPPPADDAATVFYSGAGPWGEGRLVWQMNREWDQVLRAAGQHSALLFAALANPIRVRIVAELLAGVRSTAELTRRLDEPSSGQLFHHLKELLATGVIHQPVRGSYAVREHRVIPLLALLSAAEDVAAAGAYPEPA